MIEQYKVIIEKLDNKMCNLQIIQDYGEGKEDCIYKSNSPIEKDKIHFTRERSGCGTLCWKESIHNKFGHYLIENYKKITFVDRFIVIERISDFYKKNELKEEIEEELSNIEISKDRIKELEEKLKELGNDSF